MFLGVKLEQFSGLAVSDGRVLWGIAVCGICDVCGVAVCGFCGGYVGIRPNGLDYGSPQTLIITSSSQHRFNRLLR